VEASSAPRITVVIPTLNEERTIGASIDSVLDQDVAAGELELLVVDGGSEDGTRGVVERIASESPVSIRVLDNPGRTVPSALNVALREARGSYLVRVDGHSEPTRDYVRTCVAANDAHDADLAGGWVEARGDGLIGGAVAAAFASGVSMGNPASWSRPSTPREVASVPCGSYRIEALRAIGGFDEEQAANQDYEANYRLRQAGGRVVLIPDVWFGYRTRSSLRSLARQFTRYGFYKARVMVKHPASIRARHLVPAAGLLVLIALIVAAPFAGAARWLVVACACVYVVVILAATLILRRRAGRSTIALPVVFAVMHLSWAVGNVAGLARWVPAASRIRRTRASVVGFPRPEPGRTEGEVHP